MPKIWRYVLAYDGGTAPCIDDGLLTLCTCKPRIRAAARVGDWVLATLPKRYGQGRIAYVGEVAEVIEMGAYAKRYPRRTDAIYRRTPDGQLRHNGSLYHREPENHPTDISGVNALRFEPFWYFGGQGPVLPEPLLRLCHYHVGQTAAGAGLGEIEQLKRWLDGTPPGINGVPRDRPPPAASAQAPIRTARSSTGSVRRTGCGRASAGMKL